MSSANARLAAALLVGISLVLTTLGVNLPHDTFVAGDCGVKLIATRAAIAHPDRPLQIEPLSIGGEAVRFVEPFFAPHAGHFHAVTSELFTLMSALPLSVFGVGGLYLLPGLGFLVGLVGCAWLAVELDPHRNAAVVVTVAAVCTPFFF